MMWLKQDEKWNGLGGGLPKDDSDYLQSLAQKIARPGMIGFDIGCFTGGTASYVWPVFKQNGGHLYCVDWFKGNVDSVVGEFQWGNYPAERVLIQLLKNIEDGEGLGCVSVVVAESWRLAEIIADNVADYVYIGGDHRYSEIKKDITAWLQKIRLGGVLCGHAFDKDVEDGSRDWVEMCEEPEKDYYDSHDVHFGVVRAVHELLSGYQLGGREIWSYRKPG